MSLGVKFCKSISFAGLSYMDSPFNLHADECGREGKGSGKREFPRSGEQRAKRELRTEEFSKYSPPRRAGGLY